MGIILSLLIGVLAGYLANLIMKGSGKGFWLNLLWGILGGFIGNYLFGKLGIGGGGIIWSIISATAGAVLLIWIISLFKKK